MKELQSIIGTQIVATSDDASGQLLRQVWQYVILLQYELEQRLKDVEYTQKYHSDYIANRRDEEEVTEEDEKDKINDIINRIGCILSTGR